MSTERGEEKKKDVFLLKDPVKVNVHVGLQLISRTSVFGVDEEPSGEENITVTMFHRSSS